MSVEMISNLEKYIDSKEDPRKFLWIHWITTVTASMFDLQELVKELKRADFAGEDRNKFIEEYLMTRDVFWNKSTREVALIIDPEFHETLYFYDNFAQGHRLILK